MCEGLLGITLHLHSGKCGSHHTTVIAVLLHLHSGTSFFCLLMLVAVCWLPCC